jgi:hypothetical protein
MTQESDEQFLLRYLWHHHVPCPRCSRDLHALSNAACPHCSEALRIGIGMAQPHLRGWLALAIPIIASAGVGLMLLILVLLKGLPRGMYPMMQAATCYFCATIPLAAATVIFRRKIMRASQPAQVIVAIAAWIFSTAALFLMFIRR